jgi:hypothetical protein
MKGVRNLQAVRSVYGKTKFEFEDLIEAKIDHLIELTYYKIRNKNDYAIEVVKTEHVKSGLKVEREKVNLFTNNETKTDNILALLKKNKVTPIGLKDTLIEISKKEI